MSQQDSLFKEPRETGATGSAEHSAATPFSARPAADTDLAARLSTAQRQLTNLLILLLVVSGTLSIFLLQQVRYLRADMRVLQTQSVQLPQARQLIAEYNQKSVPRMKAFMEQLGEYAKTHRDVLPILAKYGLLQARPGETGDTAP